MRMGGLREGQQRTVPQNLRWGTALAYVPPIFRSEILDIMRNMDCFIESTLQQ